MPESTKPAFQQAQHEFTDYIRNPVLNPAPADVKADRINMYRHLVFNNLTSFLTANFPVLHLIMDDQQWQNMAQDFFEKHRNRSPYFSEIPEEFLHYLQHERTPVDTDPPFMLELTHYEWVEMALSIAKEETPVINTEFVRDPASFKITLSPLAWPLLYQYPVHLITPQNQPKQPPAQVTCLIVYRTLDDQVKFIEITPFTFHLLQFIQEQQSIKTLDCLEHVCRATEHTNPESLKAGGLQILQKFSAKGIVCHAGS